MGHGEGGGIAVDESPERGIKDENAVRAGVEQEPEEPLIDAVGAGAFVPFTSRLFGGSHAACKASSMQT
jgi:hypothetical protein